MKPRAFLLLLIVTAFTNLRAVSFIEWQFAHFSSAELMQLNVSGAAACPAGDGLSNWLKYAFDLNPHAACIEGAPAAQMWGGALALNFFRRTDTPYVFYQLEASPDLTHWSLRNSYQPSATFPAGGAAAQWLVADPYEWPAGMSKFLRLRIEGGFPGMLFYYPPDLLTARTVIAPYGLELRWSDHSNAELGYRIERQRLEDGVWDLFAITGQDTITYFDPTALYGVAYLYRIRAMFPGGYFSDWCESGVVTPGGGGPGGPGDPGGGGPPDPDPDSDSDSYKDSVDAYPHDKRRSRDLPTMTYAEIDISTPIIGNKDVTMIALDDDNQAAFSYFEDPNQNPPGDLKVILWKNGAQVGDTLSYPLSAQTSGEEPPAWLIYPGLLNATGTIAGTATQTRPIAPATDPVSYESKACAFTQSATVGGPTFLHGTWGGDGGVSSGYYGPVVFGLTGTGVIWGEQSHSSLIRSTDPNGGNFNFIGETKFPFLHDLAHPPNRDGPDDPGADLGPSFSPRFVNKNLLAAGTQILQDAPYRYSGSGQPAVLAGKAACALSDNGNIFGVAASLPPATGQPADSLTPYFWTAADGSPTNATNLLPTEFRRQISFTDSTYALMNSLGDLLFWTPTLEGPEDAPEWNTKSILWTRQTSTANPHGTLAIVTNPGYALNKDRLMVDKRQKHPTNPDTGEEDLNQPAYWAALLKVPVEFVTKGDNDQPSTVNGFYNGTATPVIDAEVSNCAVSAAGTVTLNIAGTITDATSDLIDLPEKQLQTVTVKWPGGSAATTLHNTAAADLPWKPYKFEASFSQAVSFTVTGPGDYPLDLETAGNAGGQAGHTQQHVQVSETQTHIILTASLTAAAADTVRYFRGTEAQNDPSELMLETGAATNLFQFAPTAEETKIQILAGGNLTAATDSLTVRQWSRLASGALQYRDSVFQETGPATKDFVHKELTASCGHFPKTHPGTFLPIMLRFPVNGAMAAAPVRINTLDKEWKLKKKDFGDGDYLYVVDDQEKATVFNPSVNAHTHIQTKPIPEDWIAEVLHVGGAEDAAKARVTLQRLNGLLVAGGSVKETLSHYLKPETFEEFSVKLGSQYYNYYRPKRDETGNPKEVELVAPNATINSGVEIATKQETLWKYVSLPDRIAVFPSKKALEQDLMYRWKVVANAMAAKFAYVGDGTDQKPFKLNSLLWDPNGGHNDPVAGWCEVKDPSIKASTAINDIFTNAGSTSNYETTLYAVACYPGAHFVVMRSILQVLGIVTFDNAVGTAPRNGPGVDFLLKERRVTNSVNDEIFWIPGDWGMFENADWVTQGRLPGRNGENVIYLGGGKSAVRSEFENTAVFWGHGFGLGTMKQMLDTLHDWCGGTMKVNAMRRDFSQPQ